MPACHDIEAGNGKHSSRAAALRWVVLLAAFLLALAVPGAALMQALSTEYLTQAAGLVIRGRVTGLESRWSDDRRSILTRVRVSVHEVYKGTAPAKDLTVEIPGGEVGGIGMRVSDTPGLRLGEEVILFLGATGRKRTAGVFAIVGKAQGKYSVAPDGTASRCGFTVAGDRSLADDKLPVTELIAKIRRAARRWHGR